MHSGHLGSPGVMQYESTMRKSLVKKDLGYYLDSFNDVCEITKRNSQTGRKNGTNEGKNTSPWPNVVVMTTVSYHSLSHITPAPYLTNARLWSLMRGRFSIPTSVTLTRHNSPKWPVTRSGIGVLVASLVGLVATSRYNARRVRLLQKHVQPYRPKIQ